jgi:hypothetical protein
MGTHPEKTTMDGQRLSSCDDETRFGAQPVATARLVVVSGRSERNDWLLYAGSAARQLVIGSSSACDWRIHARGVRARHVRLCWHGDRLRLEALDRLGSVRVAGRPVAHRLELVPWSRLELGEARLAFEPVDPGGDPHRAVNETDDSVTPARRLPWLMPALRSRRASARSLWFSLLAFVRGLLGR